MSRVMAEEEDDERDSWNRGSQSPGSLPRFCLLEDLSAQMLLTTYSALPMYENAYGGCMKFTPVAPAQS